MNETYPNPWDFSNVNLQLMSPNRNYKIVYDDLLEICMGGPLIGSCFIEKKIDQKLLLNKFCGGPAIWETKGEIVALPIWRSNFFFGWVQHIGIFNVNKSELTIYSKKFNVLDLRAFDETKIYGYDSPKYKTKIVDFDILKGTVREKIIIK